jgi:hypothetical protein
VVQEIPGYVEDIPEAHMALKEVHQEEYEYGHPQQSALQTIQMPNPNSYYSTSDNRLQIPMQQYKPTIYYADNDRPINSSSVDEDEFQDEYWMTSIVLFLLLT